MIMMLNGPFGVGKSTIAELLRQRIPEAMIYDPEIVGTALRYFTKDILLPHEQTDDFQDIDLWPPLTVDIAGHLLRQYGRPMIVPMTIVKPAYLDTIRGGLAALGPLLHVCLMAEPETVRARLLARGDEHNNWAWQRSERYIPHFRDERFAHHISTENRTPESIVEEILALMPVV